MKDDSEALPWGFIHNVRWEIKVTCEELPLLIIRMKSSEMSRKKLVSKVLM